MVLGVCRHVLDDHHDVEDAFQATFLILVKNAHSIRDRDVLATWLHGVARRVAVRAHGKWRRRDLRERNGLLSLEAASDPRVPKESKEIQRVVHDELERLPYRYRCSARPLRIRGTHTRGSRRAATFVRSARSKSRLSRGRERLQGPPRPAGRAGSIACPQRCAQDASGPRLAEPAASNNAGRNRALDQRHHCCRLGRRPNRFIDRRSDPHHGHRRAEACVDSAPGRNCCSRRRLDFSRSNNAGRAESGSSH